MNVVGIVSAILWCCVGRVSPHPWGAPRTACIDMDPGHFTVYGVESKYQLHGKDEPGPYTIRAQDVYVPGGIVNVHIIGGDYKGVIMQARLPDSDTPIGQFINPPLHTKLTECNHRDDTVTHANDGDKNSLIYYWRAPDKGGLGLVEFV
ncbi:putative defense protein 3 [Saccoglossus kowalevskii]|uniref:Defense protein 3-like n=1 Tax=Saccoglossus kowalevskii TaxID=10224 RepID=A0ABM0MHP5_SACKO|nr:PREDICTED: putative defense protein 3-like [Saccoglossus kowalevskii]